MTRPSQTHCNDSFGTRAVLEVGDTSYRIHSLAGLDVAALPYSLRVVLENLLRHEDGHRVTSDQVQLLLDWGARPRPRPGARPEPVADVPARHQRRPDPRRPRRHADAMAELGAGPGGWSTRRSPPSSSSTTPSSPTSSAPPDAFATQRRDRVHPQRRALPVPQVGTADPATTSPSSRPAPGSCTRSTSSTWPASSRPRRAGPSRTSASAPTRTPPWSTGSASSAWGIGGIEAEAVMLGESLSMLLPRVVGFRLHGQLPEGATATDLVLTITEMLRQPRRGRQVRRVLRPRRRGHHAPRPAHHRQHEPRVRLDLRLLPDRRGDPALPAVHRPARRHASTSSRPTPGTRACGTTPTTPRSTPSWSSSTSPPSSRPWPAPADRRTGSCSPTPSGPSAPRCPTSSASTRADDGVQSKTDEASAESFPASDPPAIDTDVPEPGSDAPSRAAARHGDAARQAAPKPVEVELGRRLAHDRPRQRGHRGHHLVHQHVQPVRHGRRRPAGQERGRARAAQQALGQDQPVARARRSSPTTSTTPA